MLNNLGKEAKQALNESSLEKEGNAFTAGLAKAKKGETFKVDGKTVKDTSGYDNPSVKENTDAELDSTLSNLATRLKGQTLPYDKLEQIAAALEKQGHEINARYLQDYLKKHDVKVNEYDYKDNYPGSWGYREGEMKDEGLNLPSPDMQATGPTIQTVEGAAYNFSVLSPSEREQLKEYINSIKTIKEEIKKLVSKAKPGANMESDMGGDRTGLVMTKDTMSENGEEE